MPELCIHQLGLGEIVIIAGFVVYFLCKLLPVFLAISILLILLGTLIFRLNDHNNYWHKRGIQGPKGNLLFGSMLDLLRSIHEFDKKQSEKRRRPVERCHFEVDDECDWKNSFWNEFEQF
uniref:Uncharacterized protein n=1 Tax=Panagrolaimus sp. JU765 TaxID=591449 RepID=A0AC34R792_9BILA